MKRLGVLGWPVAHSRSPAMQNAALAALGLSDWHYQRLPVPPALFAETVRALPEAGFAGANVTIPHKRAALELAGSASDAAREIGAANTLTFRADGGIEAENTDAPGLIAALGFPPRGARALVLGAGGSARAAIWALREAGASEVSIWNRTRSRAQELASEFGVRAVASPVPADLLVNCTSVGLTDAREELDGDGKGANVSNFVELSASEGRGLNQLGLTFDQVGEYANVVDLVYTSHTTALLAAAGAHGAHTVDGLQILVAQGALSLGLWTGLIPDEEIMREAARAA
jgi:shikimate dehydrogenase